MVNVNHNTVVFMAALPVVLFAFAVLSSGPYEALMRTPIGPSSHEQEYTRA